MKARLETPDSIWMKQLYDGAVFSAAKGYYAGGRRIVIAGYSYIHSAT